MKRKGLGLGKGKGYYNIAPMDSHIHSLSAKGVRTQCSVLMACPKKDKKLNAMGHSKVFKVDKDYSVTAWWENTSYGFRHVAVLYYKGNEVARDKATYYNRTWESFEFQSVVRSLLNKYFPEGEAVDKIKKFEKQRTMYAKGNVVVPDVDEIYTGGDFVNSKKDETGQFETIEVWSYEGKEFFIGRNYKEGESILLDVQELDAKGTYDLSPRYDARQKFYGKARVDVDDDKMTLISYNTKVAEIVKGKPKVFGYYSMTTFRHIREFLKQNGFKAESKAQILKDYKG